jgi:subtilisin family serine protease
MSSKRLLLAAAVVAAAGAGCGTADVAGPGKSLKVGSAVRDALTSSARVRVIVSLNEPSGDALGMTEFSRQVVASRESVLDQLTPAEFQPTSLWEHIPAMAGDVTLDGLARLEAHPAVRSVHVVPVWKPYLAEAVPLMHGDSARAAGFTGRGVVVAVLDTGADTRHPDIGVSVLEEVCSCTGCCPNGSSKQTGSGSARDDDGHGTHVAGIIAAPGIAQPVGVAPGAFVHAVKVLGPNGGSFEGIVGGLEWVLTRPEVKVVNMSLGGGRFSSICDDALAPAASAFNSLRARGTLVVVAAGNEAYPDAVGAPACLSTAFTVGAVYDSNVGGISWAACPDATTAADQVACFSNSSPLVDVYAPGALIVSAGLGGGTKTLGGTSQATPAVAGAAAVMLEANPSLSPTTIISTLKNTGRSITDPKSGLTRSRIDVGAAVRAVR